MLARNMASMSALSLYRNAVQFALNILMARFILPAEYGLLVFTAPFLAFLGLRTDLGLSSAIVRSKGLSERQTSAAFTLTLLLGVALALLLGALAWPIQNLVHMRGLGPVMAAMSGVVLLNVASSVPRALLERHLRYGRIAGIEATAVLISAAAAVVAALLGAGVWALVGYNLLTQLLRAVAFGWLARSDLRLEFGWTGLKPLLTYLTFGLSYPLHLVLSPRWDGVPAIVTWLAPLGALQSIASYNGAILLATGKPRLQFLLSLANTIVTVRFGLFPLIRTYVVVASAMSLVMLAVTVRASAITWGDLGRAMAPAAGATAAGLAAALLVGRLADSDGLRWTVSTLAFAVVVLAAYAGMFRHMRSSLAALVAPAAESAA